MIVKVFFNLYSIAGQSTKNHFPTVSLGFGALFLSDPVKHHTQSLNLMPKPNT